MIDLTPQNVIDINNAYNKADAPWVNKALLDSAFSAYYYYQTELEQICAIFRGLVKNHAFSDGNKRTASAVLVTFLETNGWELDSEDLCIITLDVATHNYDVNEIVQMVDSKIHKI